MGKTLKKLAELLLGLVIVVTLLTVVWGGASMVDPQSGTFRWLVASIVGAAGAGLWIGANLNPMAFWVGPFRPRPEEVTPAMEAWAAWILGVLGTGFVVTAIAYGFTGYLWLIIAVFWVFVLLYSLVRLRIWWVMTR
jgi:hypothetical protein